MAEPIPNASSRIFISYRREDSSGHVLALLPALRTHFGAARIFKDTDNIPPGADFLKFIKRELESCAVLLAIIGREWLTIQDSRLKRRRLDNPDDFLRVEVATALKNERIRVIPVLIERTNMPAAEDLPPDLSEFAYRNAIELSDGRWDSDVQLLIQAIERAVAEAAPAPAEEARGTGFLDLQRRRTREIASQISAARAAFETADYEGALLALDKALLLDPQRSDALELLDRARKAIDEQKIQGWLTDARTALTRSDVASASELIDQALAVDHQSKAAIALRNEVLALRRERERERERDRVVAAAMDRARTSVEEEDFEAAVRHADDALAIDPEAKDALDIRTRALTALDQRRKQREIRRRAQQIVSEARAKFDAGEHESALQLLRDAGPSHELVTQTLQQMQLEFDGIAEKREIAAREAAQAEAVRRRAMEELERNAADVIGRATRMRAGRDFKGAIDALAAFTPLHAGVSKALEEARAQLAGETERRRALGRALIEREDFEAARNTAAEWLAFDADSAEASALGQAAADGIQRIEQRRREELAAAEKARAEAARAEAVRVEAVRVEAVRVEAARAEAARAEAARLERARQEAEAREARERAAREEEAREKETRERAEREKEAREKAAREQAAKEKAAKEQAEKERTERERERLERARAERARAEAPATAASTNIEASTVQPMRLSRVRQIYEAMPEFWPHVRVSLGAAATVVVGLTAGVWYFGSTQLSSPRPSSDAVVNPGPSPDTNGAVERAAPGGATSPPDTAGRPQPSAPVEATSPPIVAAPVATPPDPVEQRLATLRATAGRQLQRGQSPQALDTATQGLQLAPGDPRLRAIVDSLLRDARATTRRSRTLATNAGADTLAERSFRDAVNLENSATQLTAANRTDAAIRTLWTAREGFDRAAREAGIVAEQARLNQLEQERLREKDRAAAAAAAAAAARPRESPPTPPRPAAAEETKVVESRPPATQTRAPDRAEEERRVRGALQRYEAAYDDLDAGSVRAVYPGAPSDLDRLFAQYQFYRLEIIVERVELSPDATTAVAVCRLSHFFQPRVGSRQQYERSQRFSLQKRGEQWIISQVQGR